MSDECFNYVIDVCSSRGAGSVSQDFSKPISGTGSCKTGESKILDKHYIF